MFDERASGSINTSNISRSWALYDRTNHCYHWHFCASASVSSFTEYAFDFEKGGWFQVSRAGGNSLEYGTEVSVPADGRQFPYGLHSGKMFRLESGNDFDGTAIAQTFQTGDIAIHNGSVAVETKPRFTGLITEAKSSSTDAITLNHYGDGKTNASSTWTQSPQKSGYSIAAPVESHGNHPASIFHSIKATQSTDNEADGFEPLYLYLLYTIHRDHRRDYK